MTNKRPVGRPAIAVREEVKSHTVTLRLSEAEHEQLELARQSLAAISGIAPNKSQVIRFALEEGLRSIQLRTKERPA